MRVPFSHGLAQQFEQEKFVFLTGDLGYNALEPLAKTMGKWFINAGVAEQNMVGVAAGLAQQGIPSWVYSIAPFCYARPFEQIRNDLCIHNFPVKLIGNGGGYGYGVMGATHHALEDYGVLLTLPNLQVFVPAFKEDLPSMIQKCSVLPGPAYLRLGASETPKEFPLPPYQPWRRLLSGNQVTLVAVGPLIGGMVSLLQKTPSAPAVDVWVVSELPLQTPPDEFRSSLEKTGRLCVVEEHVAQGSFGQMMAHWLCRQGIGLQKFQHLCAQGYPSGYYGSQAFHRKESSIDPQSVLNHLVQMSQ